MLQPGLNISILASTVASRPEATRFNSTMGVRPMSSVTSFAQWAIALHLSFSDQNGHDTARGTSHATSTLPGMVTGLESCAEVLPSQKVSEAEGQFVTPCDAIPSRGYQ